MFSEGGGDTTFLVLNAPTPSTSQGMIPDGMGKKGRPGKTEYIPIFDPMAVAQLHTIHSLRVS